MTDRDIWTSDNRDIGNANLLFFQQYQIQPVTVLELAEKCLAVPHQRAASA